jgi:hypothetical protein
LRPGIGATGAIAEDAHAVVLALVDDGRRRKRRIDATQHHRESDGDEGFDRDAAIPAHAAHDAIAEAARLSPEQVEIARNARSAPR